MIRITSGEFRGRMLRTPAQQGTRPTQAMLRQALFNSLQVHVPGAKVLDLFAGSGALGFEALSRGAEYVTFVEQAHAAVKCVQQNIDVLGVKDKTRLLAESIERALPALEASGPFDVILADPPYGLGWEQKLLEGWPWDKLLAEEGIFSIEWGTQKKGAVQALPDSFPFLVKIREKTYGESVLTTYQKKQ